MGASENEVNKAWDDIRLPAVETVDACMRFLLQRQLFQNGFRDPTLTSQLPLTLPPLTYLSMRLNSLNLPRATHLQVELVLNKAISSIDIALQESYQKHLPLMCTFDESDSNQSRSLERNAHGLRNVLHRLRYKSIEKLWKSLLLHLPTTQDTAPVVNSSCKSRQLSTNSPCPQMISRQGRPCVFSKEQTIVLRTLLSHDDRYTPEDKHLIATVLNLTREQVNRWFCNARARKKPYQKLKGKKSAISVLCQTQLSTAYECSPKRSQYFGAKPLHLSESPSLLCSETHPRLGFSFQSNNANLVNVFQNHVTSGCASMTYTS